MATQKLADWISKLTSELIPATVKEAAVKSFTNYVGCAIGGSNHRATLQLVQSYQSLPQAPGTCTVLGSKQKADPLQATLANCFAAHLHDYDDTHLATVIHPTAAVASALLAYTDLRSSQGHEISGQDFISALVAGMEVECILGVAVYPSHYDTGWHITGTVGSIGAAIAVGKAMGLSSDALVNAIGIAAAQVCGMRRHFGSHAKPLGVAFAAQAGLQSAILAQGNMTAASDSIEGPRGWIECVCPSKDGAKKALDGFVTALMQGKGIEDDRKWEVEKNTFKPFPCGIVIHPAIDGCAQLRSEGLNEAEIESVELSVHPLVLELTGKKFPKDGLEAKFSVYHGAACGLLFGKASPAEYTDEVVNSTAELRKKISATVDKSIRSDECRILVQSSKGRLEKHVEHAIGSLAKPLSIQHLQQKFVDQVEPVIGDDAASRLFEDVTKVIDRQRVSALLLR